MQRATVSIVIPTFNSAHLVTEAVDSVLAQTVPATQIVVVDDGSSDDTHVRLARYDGRVTYLRQENQGVSAARNRGVAASSGEFVAFLDADDVWHPRKLELQLEAFDRAPDLALLGARPFDWPAKAFPVLGDVCNPVVTRVTWADLVVKNHLTTSAVVVRRAALARAGQFDQTLQGPEDRDLWLRVAEGGAIGNLELPLTGYRDVPGSVSKQAERCETSMLRILHKLDARGLLRGRRLLRRKAYSYVYHSCAYLHGAAGSYHRALACSLKSFGWYPLPYRRGDVDTRAERPKRALMNLLRWVGLRPPECPAAGAVPSPQPRGV